MELVALHSQTTHREYSEMGPSFLSPYSAHELRASSDAAGASRPEDFKVCFDFERPDVGCCVAPSRFAESFAPFARACLTDSLRRGSMTAKIALASARWSRMWDRLRGRGRTRLLVRCGFGKTSTHPLLRLQLTSIASLHAD